MRYALSAGVPAAMGDQPWGSVSALPPASTRSASAGSRASRMDSVMPRQRSTATNVMPFQATVVHSVDAQRLADDRAAHAARAATAGAELGAGDPDDLDAGVLEPVVGLVVALVRHRDPWRQGEGVVAVVPLLALGGDRVEAGVDLVEGVDLHRLRGR